MILAQNQRRIFSVLATILIAVTVFFGFNIQSVKAESNIDSLPNNVCFIKMENGTFKEFPCNPEEKNFLEEVKEEIMIGATIYVLSTGACYVVDAAASTVFPPAIALAPLCSTIPTASGIFEFGKRALKLAY